MQGRGYEEQMMMDGENLKVRTYLPLLGLHSQETFREKFPHPFLINVTVEPPGTGGDAKFSTRILPPMNAGALLLMSSSVDPDRSVIEVVKKGSREFKGLIHVGRTDNNDVVLQAGGISKLHAYFTRDPASSSYLLTDAGSKNGTAVNGIRLETRRPDPLSDGALICFGGIFTFSFHSSESFYNVLEALRKLSPGQGEMR